MSASTRRPPAPKRRSFNAVHLGASLLFGLLVGVQLASVRTASSAIERHARDAPACPEEMARSKGTEKQVDDALGTKLNETNNASFARPGDRAREPVQVQARVEKNRSTVPPSNYSSPVEMMLNHFANAAMEREARKHDRWVVDSLAHLATFDGAAAYTKYRTASRKPITLVVLTVNRRVPYLAVLVSMLLRGHHPEVLMEKMDVHVMNIERRAGREGYYLFEELRQRLPFVNFYDWTEKYPKHAKLRKPYLADQRLDYIRALKLCGRAKSRWCIVMEDDAVPCVDFISKFERYVDRDVFPNASHKLEDVRLAQVAMVKLFDPYNQEFGGEHDLRNDEYARGKYDIERAKDLMEARDAGSSVEKIKYRIRRVGEAYGIVANAYPRGVLKRAIIFLKEGTSGRPTDTSIALDFVLRSHLVRLGATPSLVNHLGFYSENWERNWQGGISTDIRFQLDDGPDVSAAKWSNESEAEQAAPQQKWKKGKVKPFKVKTLDK